MPPSRKAVLAIVGMPGSGKSTAASCFSSRGFPVIRMGEVTDRILTKLHLSSGEQHEKIIRERLRKRCGQDVYARLTIDRVRKALNKSNLVIIDGLRNLAEYKFYKRNLEVFKILYINLKSRERHERLFNRTVRPLNLREALSRDRNEKTYFEIGSLKKICDFKICNNLDTETLGGKISEIIKKLHLPVND